MRRLSERPPLLFATLTVAAILFAPTAVGGEGAIDMRGNLTRDELLNQLETQQAQMNLDSARSAMERAKADFEETTRLFDEKVYTIDKLDQARQTYEQTVLAYAQAKIDLDRTRLDFLKDATLVTIVDAKKYRGDSGQVMAAVTIRNDSDLGKARVAMGEESTLTDTELASLLKIGNIIVTLKGTGATAAAIVGDPFQHIVKELAIGAEANLSYQLLDRDLDAVTVSVEFLGTAKQYTLFLRKEALQDLPTIASTQYAQQGQLGSKIRYDLELERLARTEQSFTLVVLNLPEEMQFAFLDPGSGARITQLKFTREISKINLDFEVAIPEKLPQAMVDASTSFYIVVTKQEAQREIYALRKEYGNKQIPAEKIQKLHGNKVELILIPSGTGKLDLIVGNSFKEILQGSDVEFKFNAMNSGTLALRRVSAEIELPIDWEGETTPQEIAVLDPGQKAVIAVAVKPPEGVPIGEYTLTIKCAGYAGIETVEATDKDYNVRVAPQSNITATVILVLVLVGLVLAIAIASVKISRR